MDSMRTLNTSLPGSSPKPGRREPPEQLLQAFRSAALSVTTLYKTAAADQSRAEQAGYQSALDDLLAFLDHENLGLGDGEGWRVRQWATERLDGSRTMLESDDERPEAELPPRARSSSPPSSRKDSLGDLSSARLNTRSASPTRIVPTIVPSPLSQANNISSDTFTFRAAPAYPQLRDTDMNAGDLDVDPTHAPHSKSSQSFPHIGTTTVTPLKVDAISRPSRHRHNGNGGRMTTRSSNTLGNLGSGSGHKRRLPFGDFFDIGGMSSGKEALGGGGKRGRFV